MAARNPLALFGAGMTMTLVTARIAATVPVIRLKTGATVIQIADHSKG